MYIMLSKRVLIYPLIRISISPILKNQKALMNVVTKTTIHDASTVVATRFGVTSSLYLRCKEIARKRSTPMKVTVMNEALYYLTKLVSEKMLIEFGGYFRRCNFVEVLK